MAALLTACSSDDDNNNPVEPIDNLNGKTLVVYFSKTVPDGVDASTGATQVFNYKDSELGATQWVAQQIADRTGADMHRITVADDYYRDCSAQAVYASTGRPLVGYGAEALDCSHSRQHVVGTSDGELCSCRHHLHRRGDARY